jgi:hypothetical protein
MGACGGKDERNADDGDDFSGGGTTTPMIILEDVSSLDPVASTPPAVTKRKKKGKRYKKNLSRKQPEFGVVSPRSRNNSMSFDELPIEDADNKINSDTTVEDLEEETNIENSNKNKIDGVATKNDEANDGTKNIEDTNNKHRIKSNDLEDEAKQEIST